MHKKVYKEPKDPNQYKKVLENYYKSIFKSVSVTQTGGILMGVCRGRISEGLDFSDNAARCVIMIGIPYPQLADPKILLKRNYLDKKTYICEQNQIRSLTGSEWYSQ